MVVATEEGTAMMTVTPVLLMAAVAVAVTVTVMVAATMEEGTAMTMTALIPIAVGNSSAVVTVMQQSTAHILLRSGIHSKVATGRSNLEKQNQLWGVLQWPCGSTANS